MEYESKVFARLNDSNNVIEVFRDANRQQVEGSVEVDESMLYETLFDESEYTYYYQNGLLKKRGV